MHMRASPTRIRRPARRRRSSAERPTSWRRRSPSCVARMPRSSTSLRTPSSRQWGTSRQACASSH
eukprot:1829422-Prymnesium_polylepis.1